MWYVPYMAHQSSDNSRRSSQIVMGDRGRLVLPAGIRRDLGINKGTRFQVSQEKDGSLRLKPYAAIARASRGMFAHLPPEGVSMADELIAERRQEARREKERFGS